MDFFTQQDDARRRSGHLVACFALAVCLINLSVYLALVAALRLAWSREQAVNAALAPFRDSWWHPPLLLGTVLAVCAIILAASFFKTRALAGGGPALAAMLGARPVNPDTGEAGQRRLLNIVEEMSIAAGLPVPGVCLLEDETVINAFAAGRTPDDAVIGVTRGALERLDRDQLQGVVAHEFSHILNGDMRLNLKLVGILHGILVIGIIGYGLFRAALGPRAIYGGHPGYRGRRHSGGPLPLLAFGLLIMAIGYIGVFFGRLIKSAVSREREFLADAAAVQFTRNPAGIAGALRKIGGAALLNSSILDTPAAQEASHIFFASAVYNPLARLLNTHPPLAERIRRLDPSFNGVFPRAPAYTDPPPTAAAAAPGPPTEAPTGAPTGAIPGAVPGAGPGASRTAPGRVLDSIGTVDPEHLAWAATLLADIPDPLRQAAREPEGAAALALALLFSDDPAARERQDEALRGGGAAAMGTAAAALRPHLDRLSRTARLPLLDLALPSLRRLDRARYLVFRDAIETLIAADNRVSLFEAALQAAITRHLAPLFEHRPAVVTEFYHLQPVLPACATLLTALARYGNEEEAAINAAREAGFARLGLEPPFPDPAPAGPGEHAAVSAALNTLAAAAPAIKKQVVDACLHCAWANRRVTDREAEMLRLTADMLDCPVPPLIAGPAATGGPVQPVSRPADTPESEA